MNRKTQLVFAAFSALLCWLCLASGAFGQTLPDGKGKAEFVRVCTACHGTDLVTQHRRTAAEWQKNVSDMVDRGADGSKQEIDDILAYLIANFGSNNSSSDKAGSAKTGSAAPSSTGLTATGPAALDSATTERAKRIVAQNGCLACHRVGNQGGYTGPTLNGVSARRTPDQIRSAILSPHPTLDPGNDLVRLTTADGKTVNGRIVSQDDRDVRVIDASGEVTTYAKPELRQLTTISANPMPSFEGKITGDDLDTLVRYLNSLPSAP